MSGPIKLLLGTAGVIGTSSWLAQEISKLPITADATAEDLSLLGLIKYLVVTIPALAMLGLQIWLNHKSQQTREKREQDAQQEREKREEERDKRNSEERQVLAREFTETVKSSLVALTEHGRLIKELTDTLRTGQDRIIQRLDSIDRRRGGDP